MPFVLVNMLATRTREQKQTIVTGIKEAFEKSGTPGESIHVIFNDVPKSNWGEAGESEPELPFIVVYWWATRTQEQKNVLISGISDAFEKSGTPGEDVHVILNDVPKNNWGAGGGPASEKYPNRLV